MEARELLENGVRRRIGNGKSTRIWEDRWIPDSSHGRVTNTKTTRMRIAEGRGFDHSKKVEQEPDFQKFSIKMMLKKY